MGSGQKKKREERKDHTEMARMSKIDDGAHRTLGTVTEQ